MTKPTDAIIKLKSDIEACVKFYEDELVKLRTKAKNLSVNIDAAKVDAFAKDVEKMRVTLGAGIVALQGIVATGIPAEIKKIAESIAEIKKDYREFGGNVS